MLVSMIPLDIVEADARANVAKVVEYSRHLHPDTSLIVLPELFSTGFFLEESAFATYAEPFDGPTMSALKALSAEKNVAIAGSFMCRDNDGAIVNRAFFINPDRDCETTIYDKRHLFSLSLEHKLFKAGDMQPPVVNYRGWNIALAVCFDLRFPVWTRNTGCRYDMLLYPANWPDSRFYAWKHLLIARAIENQAVVIGCNRAGADHYGIYSYLSTFGVDERGEIVVHSHSDTPVRYAEFSLEALKDYRRKFPFALSADEYSF